LEALQCCVPAQANKGKDPYSEPPRGRRRAPADAADPDLETVGLVLQGTRLYFLGGVLLAASAASPVLIKARARCVLGQKAGQEGTCGHAPFAGQSFPQQCTHFASCLGEKPSPVQRTTSQRNMQYTDSVPEARSADPQWWADT